MLDTETAEWRGSVQAFMIDSAVAASRPFQGHREMRLEGRWLPAERTVPMGSFLVHTNQPQGILAMYLLEPQSDDGLVAWNFLDASARAGAEFPVLRLLTRLPQPTP